MHFKNLVGILCMILFTQLTSCEVIRVSSDPISGKLILKDKKDSSADTFVITSGKIVKWKIGTGTIKSFDSMPPKMNIAGNSDVFKRDPHKKFLTKTFKGKLVKTEVIRIEHYNIIWKDQDGTSHTYDPTMQVNPR